MSAAYLGPAPGTPTSTGPASPPGAPKPASADIGTDGSFAIPITLAPGRWTLTITAKGATDPPATETLGVTVPYGGATVVVKLTGGDAVLKAWVDGAVDPRTGSAGKTFADGKTVTFTGSRTVELRTTDPSVTYVTVNGVSLGRLSKGTDAGTWLFAPPKAPERTDRT